MPIFSDLHIETITAAGGTYTMAANENLSTYIFKTTGSITLLAGYSVTADPAVITTAPAVITTAPRKVRIYYQGEITLNGQPLSFFGVELNQEQASSGNVVLDCLFDGSAWNVTIVASANDSPPNNDGANTTTLTAGGGTITLTPGLDNEWQELVGSPTLAGSWVIDGQSYASGCRGGKFLIHYAATATPATNNVTIFGTTLSQTQIANGEVFVFAYFDLTAQVWRSVLLQNPAKQAWIESGIFEVSFEAGEICRNRIGLSFNCIFIDNGWSVTKAIEATDNATIDLQIGGVSVNGNDTPLTLAAGSALDTRGGGIYSSNNVYTANTDLALVAAKNTPGGRCKVQISYIRTA